MLSKCFRARRPRQLCQVDDLYHLFVGQNDPWSAQSITKTLSSRLIVISLGAHDSDLGGPMNPKTDTHLKSLIDVRKFEIQTLRKWIWSALVF